MTTPPKLLTQYYPYLVEMLLGLGQVKIAKILPFCFLVWLSWQQKHPIAL